jgi:hypothetical protein
LPNHYDTSHKNQDRNAATFYNGYENFLKYSVPQGTPLNVPALLQGLVSYEVIQKLYILSIWMICRKANIRAWQIFQDYLTKYWYIYQYFLDWQGKEPEFVGTGKHASPQKVGMIYRSAELLVGPEKQYSINEGGK